MLTIHKLSVFALLFVFLLTTGCAVKTPMPKINAEYYPQCYAPFKKLHESQVALQKRTIGYTAGGAVVGAFGGALLGLLRGNWQSVVIGGVTGAVAGGMTGYNLAKIQDIKDEQKRMMIYQVSMRADLVNSTEVEIAALQALKCYIQEFENLQREYAEKRITKEEFSKRYAEIRTGITEIGKITSGSHTMLVQRDAELRTALQKEKGLEQPLPTVEERRAIKNQKVHKAAVKSRKKRQRSRGKTPHVPAPETSSLAMAELKGELDQLQEEAVTKKAQYNIENQKNGEAANGSKEQKPAPVSMQQVAATFNDYPDNVLRMETVEQQRKKTLEIMDNAAMQSGIDMV